MKWKVIFDFEYYHGCLQWWLVSWRKLKIPHKVSRYWIGILKVTKFTFLRLFLVFSHDCFSIDSGLYPRNITATVSAAYFSCSENTKPKKRQSPWFDSIRDCQHRTALSVKYSSNISAWISQESNDDLTTSDKHHISVKRRCAPLCTHTLQLCVLYVWNDVAGGFSQFDVCWCMVVDIFCDNAWRYFMCVESWVRLEN